MISILLCALHAYFGNFDTLSKEEKWDEILARGHEALQVAHDKGEKGAEAKIAAQLTSTAFYRGDYTLALAYSIRCYALAESFEDPSLLIRALYLKSAIHRAFGTQDPAEFGSAVAIAQEALALYQSKQLNNPFLLGKVYFNLGAAHADNPQGDLEKAQASYAHALLAYQKADSFENTIRTRLRQAKVHLLQHNYSQVEATLEEVRPAIPTIRISSQADYLEAQLRLAQAIESAQAGLKKARELGAKEDIRRFTKLLYSLGAGDQINALD